MKMTRKDAVENTDYVAPFIMDVNGERKDLSYVCERGRIGLQIYVQRLERTVIII